MTINRSPLIIECQDVRFRTFSTHLKHFFIEIFAFYNKTLYFCISKLSLRNIWKSISNNPIYKDIDEPTAISICIQKDVTEGNGMGFGLFSATRLIANAGISLQIHSGNHLLTFDGKQSAIREERFWQGTIVYLDLHSNVDFNPEEVANDCSEEFDEMFLDEGETSLW
jgi:hypothetical protein